MNFLSPLLLSISLNIDTLGVSGILKSKNVKLNKSSLLLISIFTTLTTFISMILGKIINYYFTQKFSNIFGAMLLSFIGVYFIIEYIRIQKKRAGLDTSYFVENSLKYKNILENPQIVDVDNSHFINIYESISLSYSLCLNNIVASFAASITGISIPLTIFLNFIFTILAFCIGNCINSSKISSFINNYTNLISGMFLIVLGIVEMFV